MEKVKSVFRYLSLSFVVTYAILLLFIYLFKDSIDYNIISIFYIFTTPLYYYLLLFVLFIIFLPFALSRFLSYIFLIIKVLIDYFLIIDFLIFRSYKFHIDSLFINMFIHDIEGLGISAFGFSVAALILVAIFLLNFFIFTVAKKSSFKVYKLNIAVVVVFVLNQIVHIWGAYFNQDYITKYTPYFPYYIPTTSTKKMQKLAKKYPIIIPKHIGEKVDLQVKNSGYFNYPKAKLNAIELKKYNILFIVLESWQAKQMNKETTPNIYSFAQNSLNFTNHYSSGNVTLTGLYGLMYGLYATNNLKASMASPLKYTTQFTKLLKNNGYDIGVYTSSNLYRFSFKDMFFAGIKKENMYILNRGNIYKNDAKIVDLAVNDIKKQNNKPWFKFLFLTSSHFPYRYPKEYTKFKPVAKNMEAFLLDSSIDATPFKNRYKNSLYYSDALLKKLFNVLDSKLDNTIVVITGDHAEEFNENGAGFWGHGSNYTIYQTKTPMIIRFPDKVEANTTARSYHIDIVPTILKYMGLKNKIKEFSNGENLLKINKNRDMIFASYKNRAYLINNDIISVGLFVNSYKVDNYNIKSNIKMSKIKHLREKENSFFK